FVDILIVTVDATPNLLGDYHLQASSPAIDMGAPDKAGTNAPGTDIDGDIRPAAGGYDAGADESGSGTPPAPTVQLYFSTTNDSAVPGVPAPHDDADIYSWDGSAFDRIFNASTSGLPGNTADIDALYVVDADTIYMSFKRNGGVNVPTLGTVQDEDVVLYDAGTWSMFFDGSDVDLAGPNGRDVDAFHLMPDGSILISIAGNFEFTGIGGIQRDEDLIQCVGTFGPNTTCSWSMYFDGGDVDLSAGSEDIDGGARAGNGNLYLSTLGNFNIPQLLTGSGSDVFVCMSPTTGSATTCSGFTKFFDSAANGISDNLDAIALP
ncbi:MAG: choice-of-anchor Q domain-containing protein, partial [Anaerolineae bacterium]